MIWLFMQGGASQMETFDPKPALNKYAGMSIDETPYKHILDSKYKKNTVEFFGRNRRSFMKLFPLQVGYGKRGQSGIEVTDWCVGGHFKSGQAGPGQNRPVIQ